MDNGNVPECTGKCKMVETYKAINRALTKQHSDMKETLALLKMENTKLKKQSLDNVISLSNVTTEAIAAIQQILSNTGAKVNDCLANTNRIAENGDQNSEILPSISNCTAQTKSATNVSRIRPLIRTPNGLMQLNTVSISLPRIDLESSAFLSSTTISQANGEIEQSSEVASNFSEESENSHENEIDTESLFNTNDVNRDSPDITRHEDIDGSERNPMLITQLPRRTSDQPFLGFTETEMSRNDESNVEENGDYSYYDAGLSVIPELTEIEYSRIPSVSNGIHHGDESSSGGEEVIQTMHRARTSSRANKENSLTSRPIPVSQASSSTPYNPNHPSISHFDHVHMNNVKVVLQPLNKKEIAQATNERSIEPSEVKITNRKRTTQRNRNDSEVSGDSTDDERSMRPKRRVTPTSLKEPSLNKKLRREK